ncbi:helix-turn-helix transcriptional regulator [Kitasatospora sp. MAP5-34]|uniref:helix-turn-helix domain-containing protein n=1 Tax=Kitasatospora sp. MAP5-34 TaxID=3035102 RepID=UPI0024731442|nr:helix-turn-helix transcriptional regulator [Kitasatospora sp. MAP5-34]
MPFLAQVAGRRLRRWREDSGHTRESAGELLEISPHAIQRHEMGVTRLRARDVISYAETYRVTDPQAIKDLGDLARQGATRGWWTEYGGLLDPAYTYVVEAEQMACYGKGIRMWNPSIVPGLFQTDEYTESVFERAQLLWKEDNPLPLPQAIESRQKRKELLDGLNPPEIWAVLSQAAVDLMVGGPEVMQRQYKHLLDLCERPRITIQILTHDSGYHVGTDGPFVSYSFSRENDDDGVVYYDNSRSITDQVATLRRHSKQFDLLRAQAIPLAGSRSYFQAAHTGK